VEATVIEIPDSRLCHVASDYARRVSEASLFHHVMRTYAFGVAVAARRGIAYDRELFFIAAVLHDIGLTDEVPAKQRYEIEGADAAKELLACEGMADADVDLVWDAIALHTTLGVPQRKRPEVALVQLGAAVDVGFAPLDLIATAAPAILEAWPRRDFKAELVRHFERVYDRNPAAALQSQIVADVIARRRGIQPPNACDVIENAAFAE
jgi:hypothetical protein